MACQVFDDDQLGIDESKLQFQLQHPNSFRINIAKISVGRVDQDVGKVGVESKGVSRHSQNGRNLQNRHGSLSVVDFCMTSKRWTRCSPEPPQPSKPPQTVMKATPFKIEPRFSDILNKKHTLSFLSLVVLFYQGQTPELPRILECLSLPNAIKTLQKQEKTPILAKKFLAKVTILATI